MKIKVYDSQISMLNHLKFKMMLFNNEIFFISEFKIENINIKKRWSKKEVIIKYLTDIHINVYDVDKKSFCFINNSLLLQDQIYFERFYTYRNNYLNLKEQFKQFGLDIIKISKPDELVETSLENS